MDLRRRMLLAAEAPAEQEYGVLIQDTTGKLWAADEWDGSATPNGIAVRDKDSGPREGILISIPQSTPSKVMFATTISYSIEGKEIADAWFDYNGYENTQNLAKIITNSSAITACTGYTFPNGQKGYLGALGEMKLIPKWRNEIDECILALGRSSMLSVMSDSLWTSNISNYSTTRLYVWATYVSSDGSLSGLQAPATNSYYVWPIGKIDY